MKNAILPWRKEKLQWMLYGYNEYGHRTLLAYAAINPNPRGPAIYIYNEDYSFRFSTLQECRDYGTEYFVREGWKVITEKMANLL